MPLTELRQYTAHTAQTATPGQLVVMLYDGFLRFCAQGRAAFEAGDVGGPGNRVTRAKEIVTEGRDTLDMTQGKMPPTLASLYEYVGEKLTAGRLQKDMAEIDEAVRVMTDLRAAWVQIAGTQRPATDRRGPVVGVNLAG